eukprot:7050619-Pyramimonas_sp.AAC.1
MPDATGDSEFGRAHPCRCSECPDASRGNGGGPPLGLGVGLAVCTCPRCALFLTMCCARLAFQSRAALRASSAACIFACSVA